MSDIRNISINALQKILEEKKSFTEIKNNLENQNSNIAFLNMLILTSLRNLVSIEKILGEFCKKKLPPKMSYVKYALILGSCELLYLNSQDYATINSYVELVKQNINKFSAGFVNAVLRNVAKNKTEMLEKYNHLFFPTDFMKILKKDYDFKTIKNIEKTAKSEAPLDITVKSSPEDLAQTINGKLMPNGSIRLFEKQRVEDINGFNSGDWWIQDLAATLPILTLGDVKEKKVLDLCAAPGGKSAQLINIGAKVTCLDISEQRLERLKENLLRLNLQAEDIIAEDGIEYLQSYNGEQFDIIVLDAPCSATGTFRRHPEIIHIKNFHDINISRDIQKQFLNNIENALKIGGILLYCTCSISKAEGEMQIKDFLSRNSNFKLVKINEKEINLYNNGLECTITKEGFIRTLPCHLSDDGGMDSFFIAKLQRTN